MFFLGGGSMKSLPPLWQIRTRWDLFCVQVRKPLLYNYCPFSKLI